MFAHKIVGLGGPDDVLWQEADEPARDGGVIIDVVAAGVSFADLLQTRARTRCGCLFRTRRAWTPRGLSGRPGPARAWHRASGWRCCCVSVWGIQLSERERE